MSQDNKLQVIAEEAGLEKTKTDVLVKTFTTYLTDVLNLTEASKKIVVTSADQRDEMLKAKELRKKLREIRLDMEEKRKKLKEQSLREGRAIDGIANWFKGFIVPAEEHLEKQEKFIEEMEKKAAEERYQKRIAALSPFVDDTSVFDLRNMSEETFTELVEKSKKAKEDSIAAQKAADEARIKKEQEEAAEKEKLRKEKEEADRKAEEERKKREELEAKIAAEKAEAERKRQEEAERNMKILRAPDKEKLQRLAQTFKDIEMPTVLSPEARKTIEDVKGLQAKLAGFILNRASQL